MISTYLVQTSTQNIIDLQGTYPHTGITFTFDPILLSADEYTLYAVDANYNVMTYTPKINIWSIYTTMPLTAVINESFNFEFTFSYPQTLTSANIGIYPLLNPSHNIDNTIWTFDPILIDTLGTYAVTFIDAYSYMPSSLTNIQITNIPTISSFTPAGRRLSEVAQITIDMSSSCTIYSATIIGEHNFATWELTANYPLTGSQFVLNTRYDATADQYKIHLFGEHFEIISTQLYTIVPNGLTITPTYVSNGSGFIVTATYNEAAYATGNSTLINWHDNQDTIQLIYASGNGTPVLIFQCSGITNIAVYYLETMFDCGITSNLGSINRSSNNGNNMSFNNTLPTGITFSNYSINCHFTEDIYIGKLYFIFP